MAGAPAVGATRHNLSHRIEFRMAVTISIDSQFAECGSSGMRRAKAPLSHPTIDLATKASDTASTTSMLLLP